MEGVGGSGRAKHKLLYYTKTALFIHFEIPPLQWLSIHIVCIGGESEKNTLESLK